MNVTEAWQQMQDRQIAILKLLMKKEGLSYNETQEWVYTEEAQAAWEEYLEENDNTGNLSENA